MDLALPDIDGDPFALGVASGDPTDTAVILWTRLVPDPSAPDGGMPAEEAPVGWEVATDEAFADVVAEGAVATGPDVAHSVHVDADGPRSGHRRTGTASRSATSSLRCRPHPHDAGGRRDARLRSRSAQVSCQRWDEGEFAAYRDLAEDGAVDLVVHCGDYIYERPVDPRRPSAPASTEPAITLDDYRRAYAPLQERPPPPGGPRRRPLGHHLGRPRGVEQLRRRDSQRRQRVGHRRRAA